MSYPDYPVYTAEYFEQVMSEKDNNLMECHILIEQLRRELDELRSELLQTD